MVIAVVDVVCVVGLLVPGWAGGSGGDGDDYRIVRWTFGFKSVKPGLLWPQVYVTGTRVLVRASREMTVATPDS